MSHIDQDDLALLALGEPVGTPEAHQHLAGCDQCRTELDALSHVADLGRQSDPAALLTAPPTDLWERICLELGAELAAPEPLSEPLLGGPTTAQLRASDSTPTDWTLTDSSRTPEDQQPMAADAGAPGQGGAVSLDQHRARRRRPGLGALAAAAAVGAILGGGLVAAIELTDSQGTGGSKPVQVVAEAVLNPLKPEATRGSAVASEGPDGLQIRVDARGLPASDGFYEVWLLDANATKLVALGALPAGSVGTFTVPPGVSLADFPIVDISLEPYDGDPGHSHDSLLRGELRT